MNDNSILEDTLAILGTSSGKHRIIQPLVEQPETKESFS